MGLRTVKAHNIALQVAGRECRDFGQIFGIFNVDGSATVILTDCLQPVKFKSKKLKFYEFLRVSIAYSSCSALRGPKFLNWTVHSRGCRRPNLRIPQSVPRATFSKFKQSNFKKFRKACLNLHCLDNVLDRIVQSVCPAWVEVRSNDFVWEIMQRYILRLYLALIGYSLPNN